MKNNLSKTYIVFLLVNLVTSKMCFFTALIPNSYGIIVLGVVIKLDQCSYAKIYIPKLYLNFSFKQ